MANVSIPSLWVRGIVAALWLSSVTSSMAQHEHHNAGGTGAAPACATHDLECAMSATPVFDRDGTLWLTWAANGVVSVAKSRDLGKSFSKSVAVHSGTLPLDNGPDARPKLAFASDRSLVVSYATRDEKYNGSAFATRSIDGGLTFEPPRAMTTGSPSQRFETMGLAGDGRLFAVWIDKRNTASAKAAGAKYAGAALAFATAEPESTAFSSARIARDNTCECCRIALAFRPDGNPVVLFRNVFDGGVRDHAVITFADSGTPGPVMRVSDDGWATDVCPHHGPSIAIAGDGTYHVAWFTAGKVRKGVFYARSTDSGKSFSEPLALGAPGRQVSRPFVYAGGDAVYLAWKEFDGERTEVRAMTSNDAGKSWGAPRTIADTKEISDHPLLISDGRKVYLSWLTQAEGYRLLALEFGS